MSVMERAVEDAVEGRLISGVLRGALVGLDDNGVTALVTFPGQIGTAAVRASASVELHGAHIGLEVVLMCERGDPRFPIVLGVIRQPDTMTLPRDLASIELDIDGRRLVVGAQEQIVLRCGKASITLTKAGKVLLEGTYVLSRSSGVNRIKGGSVQLN